MLLANFECDLGKLQKSKARNGINNNMVDVRNREHDGDAKRIQFINTQFDFTCKIGGYR